MKHAVVGVLLGLGTMLTLAGWLGPMERVYAQPSSHSTNQDLITLVSSDEDGQQLMLIDPRMWVMAVYHIDRGSGGIVLKSVRNFRWDLQLLEFNGAQPLPKEIRSMVENR